MALTLKVVAGFTTDEIARAFLSPEKTIAQRITRAKKTIEDERLPYEVPERAELAERLAAVLAVVYLIFNEGHTTREGPLMRLDLQAESLRLGRLLCDLLPNEPEVFGLFALIAFSFARAATRIDERGELLLLSEQDRSRWDRPMIKEGLMALERARRLGGRGSYVLQAAIAACHTTAPTWDATEWSRILGCYDELLGARALAGGGAQPGGRRLHARRARGSAGGARRARGAARELSPLLRDSRRLPPPAGAGRARRLSPCAGARRQRERAELLAAADRRGRLAIVAAM